MAILGVRKMRGAGTDTGEQGKQSFRTEYVVKSDSAEETRTAILGCGLLPLYGDPHPENTSAVCVGVSADQDAANPHLWHVLCRWSVITRQKRSPTEDQKSPELRRPEWRFRFVEIPQFWFHDLAGLPFSDAAGTPFSPPPELPIFVDEVTVRLYETTLDRTADRQYLNATNSDTWNGAEPYTALVKSIDAEEVFEWGQYWFRRTYTILVSPRVAMPAAQALTTAGGTVYKGGWFPTYVLNAGPREMVNDNGTPKARPIKVDGIVDGQPQPLAADGTRLPRDAEGVITPPYRYLAFRTVAEKSFGPLNLYPPWI